MFSNSANLPSLMAWRYVASFGRKSFIGFISVASVVGIALGVMVLITVLSVMNGFRVEVRERMLSLTPHITLKGWHSWSQWEEQAAFFAAKPEVKGLAPFLDSQGLFRVGAQVTGLMARGILPEKVDQVFPLSQHLLQGSLNELQPGRFGVIIGSGLAHSLGLELGSKVTLMMPELSVSIAGVMPRLRQLTVVGIFEVGYIYDTSMALMHLSDLQTLMRLSGKVTGLQIQLQDPFRALELSHAWQQQLPPGLALVDWTTQNSHYFKAVQMEKTMMFFILLLIVAIAAFNLVSTLVMVVTEKRADIAVLRTLGARTSTIIKVFIYQGLILGILGTFFGVLLGVLMALNVSEAVALIESLFQFKFLSAEVYYISFLPSKLLFKDVWLISLSALALSFIATLYPAWKAANVPPAEALRYA
jgi:lipoprotein-releasing system permease protein